MFLCGMALFDLYMADPAAGPPGTAPACVPGSGAAPHLCKPPPARDVGEDPRELRKEIRDLEQALRTVQSDPFLWGRYGFGYRYPSYSYRPFYGRIGSYFDEDNSATGAADDFEMMTDPLAQNRPRPICRRRGCPRFR